MRKIALVVAAISAFSMFAPAHATILSVGSNTIAGTTVAAEPQLAGTVVEDVTNSVSENLLGLILNATVESRVILSVDGTYDFYWRIYDISGSPIGAFRVGNFDTTVVGDNGNFRLDGPGNLGPNSILVFSNPPNGYFNFIFSNGLQPGSESYFMFIDTDAHAYARTAGFDLVPSFAADGRSSSFISTFGPAAVPEASTWAMMLLGFGAIGLAMGRRIGKGLTFHRARPDVSLCIRPGVAFPSS